MGSSIQFDTVNKLGGSLYISRGHRLGFPNYNVLQSHRAS